MSTTTLVPYYVLLSVRSRDGYYNFTLRPAAAVGTPGMRTTFSLSDISFAVPGGTYIHTAFACSLARGFFILQQQRHGGICRYVIDYCNNEEEKEKKGVSLVHLPVFYLKIK